MSRDRSYCSSITRISVKLQKLSRMAFTGFADEVVPAEEAQPAQATVLPTLGTKGDEAGFFNFARSLKVSPQVLLAFATAFDTVVDDESVLTVDVGSIPEDTMAETVAGMEGQNGPLNPHTQRGSCKGVPSSQEVRSATRSG